MGIKLYAHFVNCLRDKCGEGKTGKCGAGVFTHKGCEPVRVFVPFPKDGKCLFPCYIPYDPESSDFTENLESYEQINESVGEIDDVPF
jgi:hypothetical protein